MNENEYVSFESVRVWRLPHVVGVDWSMEESWECVEHLFK